MCKKHLDLKIYVRGSGDLIPHGSHNYGLLVFLVSVWTLWDEISVPAKRQNAHFLIEEARLETPADLLGSTA